MHFLHIDEKWLRLRRTRQAAQPFYWNQLGTSNGGLSPCYEINYKYTIKFNGIRMHILAPFNPHCLPDCRYNLQWKRTTSISYKSFLIGIHHGLKLNRTYQLYGHGESRRHQNQAKQSSVPDLSVFLFWCSLCLLFCF